MTSEYRIFNILNQFHKQPNFDELDFYFYKAHSAGVGIKTRFGPNDFNNKVWSV